MIRTWRRIRNPIYIDSFTRVCPTEWYELMLWPMNGKQRMQCLHGYTVEVAYGVMMPWEQMVKDHKKYFNTGE